MTPGEEALCEAMRLEQARIYGQTLKEPTAAEKRAEAARAAAELADAVRPNPGTPAFRDVVLTLREHGLSIAKIALRLGRDKQIVAWVVHQHERSERAAAAGEGRTR